MKYPIVLLLLIATRIGFSKVTAFYRNGWTAVIRLGKDQLGEFPLILLTYNDKVTNAGFLLEEKDSYEIALSLPDGIYDYRLIGSGKKLLEQGKLELLPLFHVSTKEIHPTGVSFELSGEQKLFVECYLYAGGKANGNLVAYERVLLNRIAEVKFEDISSGTSYMIEFLADGFSWSESFSTPLNNVALNKPVTGTFNRLPESQFVDDSTPAITRVNDGKWKWYSGMAVSEEISYRKQMVLINLLQPRQIKLVRVVWHAHYYPLKYSFVYSMDGANWKMFNRFEQSYQKKLSGDNSPILIDEFKLNVKATYIGIVIDKDEKIYSQFAYRNYVELMEIEAYE